ncbi:hypothetical protein LSM04_002274 [Trypanosoma melophagium]|uniref:uncharacterized protein n=1 Tax=Trypanosoma melophagium TaxID=715481 RepID=UPI00351A759D|nr:hypothetical protein LSM04_002274 [Trypanosoma melophagium]
MYTVVLPAASTTDVHVSGSSRNIKEIDLAAVFFTREDKETLSLITSFDLSHNHIEQLHQLDALVSLTRLTASHNRIVKIGSLPVTITQLDVSYNKLQTLDGIGRLPHLRELNVSYNRLYSLNGFTRAQPLQVLRADGNRLVTTAGVEGMTQLRLLSLDHNMIDNANELLFLSSTPALEMFSLRENPVTGMTGYRALVAHLQPSVLSLDGAPLLRDGEASFLASTVAPEPMTQFIPQPTPCIQPRRTENTQLISTEFQSVKNSTAQESNFKNRSVRAPERIPRLKKPTAATTSTMATTSTVTTNDEIGYGGNALVTEGSHPHNHNHHQDDLKRQPNNYSEDTLKQKQKRFRSLKDQGVSSDIVLSNGSKNTVKVPISPPLEPIVDVVPSSSDTTERELHETKLHLEELKKENEYLRTRNKGLSEQLKDTRRVISSQLDEINELKVRLDATEASENALKERLDRVKRNARVVDKRTHDTVDAMVVEQERMKAVYEAQIADLRHQLRRVQPKSSITVTERPAFLLKQKQKQKEQQEQQVTRNNNKLKQSTLVKETRALDSSSEVQQGVLVDDTPSSVAEGDRSTSLIVTTTNSEINTPNHPSMHRTANVKKLAGELKNWLYAEMAEDARREEEDRVLEKLHQSIEREKSIALTHQYQQQDQQQQGELNTLPFSAKPSLESTYHTEKNTTAV